MDDSIGKISFVFCLIPGSFCTRQIGANDRIRIFFNVMDRALGNHGSAIRSGTSPHFHQPVCFFQNLRIVVYQKN